jgi:NAD(P)-dependent dehydrogenase (short-subunit alcohol dehydrogenase family)
VETIVRVNALGSLHVNDVFLDVVEPGGCVVDVSSMSAHLVPRMVLPRGLYAGARLNPKNFVRLVLAWTKVFPAKIRSSIAYGISKDFVVWLARSDAARFGERNLRVLSVSPGNFDTPIGDAEAERVAEYINRGAIKRLGRVEEIAELLAFCVADRASFLTGTDILCDGGVVAAGA